MKCSLVQSVIIAGCFFSSLSPMVITVKPSPKSAPMVAMQPPPCPLITHSIQNQDHLLPPALSVTSRKLRFSSDPKPNNRVRLAPLAEQPPLPEQPLTILRMLQNNNATLQNQKDPQLTSKQEKIALEPIAAPLPIAASQPQTVVRVPTPPSPVLANVFPQAANHVVVARPPMPDPSCCDYLSVVCCLLRGILCAEDRAKSS